MCAAKKIKNIQKLPNLRFVRETPPTLAGNHKRGCAKKEKPPYAEVSTY
jgi:hypothetical protein